MSRRFFIAGVQHHQLHKVLAELQLGTKLDLVPEPTNKFDPNAIRIQYKDTMCGYVPKRFSSEISAALEVGTLTCTIITLNKTSRPWEQCEVEIT